MLNLKAMYQHTGSIADKIVTVTLVTVFVFSWARKMGIPYTCSTYCVHFFIVHEVHCINRLVWRSVSKVGKEKPEIDEFFFDYESYYSASFLL